MTVKCGEMETERSVKASRHTGDGRSTPIQQAAVTKTGFIDDGGSASSPLLINGREILQACSRSRVLTDIGLFRKRKKKQTNKRVGLRNRNMFTSVKNSIKPCV